mgnify:CR=1 FL=1
MQEHPIQWERADNSRIPFAVYTQEATHRKELDRFFYHGHWSYVGLEAEIAQPGDFKRTVIGERSVIMTRDHSGNIHVVENVCAHRGMAFCRERHGNRKEFVCPYHQWTYGLDGKLLVAGFVPGIVSAFVYAAIITWRCWRQPELGPRITGYTWPQRFQSLPGTTPTVLTAIFAGPMLSPRVSLMIGCPWRL